jgi:hypothetical protein
MAILTIIICIVNRIFKYQEEIHNKIRNSELILLTRPGVAINEDWVAT